VFKLAGHILWLTIYPNFNFMMPKLILTALLFFSIQSFAQNDSIMVSKDSLHDVMVTGFYSHAKWKDAPAAISILNEQKLQQFSPNSLVPVLNTVAGVRMEERSPGSYRLSIRGSLLRSPFGVRNIKVYWNDLPLSDGGGSTYLQLVELQGITGTEILKGPVASVYGANTGGVVLLKSELPYTLQAKKSFAASVIGGSYNLLAENISWKHQQKNFSMQLLQSHQQSDGYREQSAMRKNVLQWNGNTRWKNNQLGFLAFYTDLYYQTPGGITEAQMLFNPKLSRQATATLPSAVQQHAAIYNKTLFAGINHNSQINPSFNLESSATTSFTWFKNPFITNYEERNEQNLALRTKLVYHHQFNQLKFQWITGAEWLSNHSRIDNYGNRNGIKDTVQFMDRLFANQWFAFTQVQFSFARFNVNAGVSLNEQLYKYKRLPAVDYVHSSTKIIAAPRIALLYKLSNDISLYALAAKGFSPPSLAEVHPSDGNFYSNLQAEYGWNVEAGLKGNILNNKLMFDIAFYRFKLQDAIVRRNNAAATEYFINAGSTIQQGIEASIQYKLIDNNSNYITSLSISNSYSYQPYRFNDYMIGTSNYSGNAITGVPKTINVSALNIVARNWLFANFSFNYTSSIPLTDANDAYSTDYRLGQIKIGCKGRKNSGIKISYEIFMGMDNVFDQLYSLGNDINALGKRYFNPAPSQNGFVGIKVCF
jgi:iron complex outermembrane receptor protein